MLKINHGQAEACQPVMIPGHLHNNASQQPLRQRPGAVFQAGEIKSAEPSTLATPLVDPLDVGTRFPTQTIMRFTQNLFDRLLSYHTNRYQTNAVCATVQDGVDPEETICLNWNLCFIHNQNYELVELNMNNNDIAIITETHPKPKLFIIIPDFRVVRLNRCSSYKELPSPCGLTATATCCRGST